MGVGKGALFLLLGILRVSAKTKKRAAGMVHMTTPTALFVDWVMKLRFLPAQENRATHFSDGSNSRNYVIYSLIQAGETNRDL